MPEYNIYAMKVVDWGTKVHSAMCSGQGRFGWSYVETANLIDRSHRVEVSGWNSLTAEEKDCYQPFLLELHSGDWVVYSNTPSWGRCTLAQVTQGYFWEWTDE